MIKRNIDFHNPYHIKVKNDFVSSIDEVACHFIRR